MRCLVCVDPLYEVVGVVFSVYNSSNFFSQLIRLHYNFSVHLVSSVYFWYIYNFGLFSIAMVTGVISLGDIWDIQS